MEVVEDGEFGGLLVLDRLGAHVHGDHTSDAERYTDEIVGRVKGGHEGETVLPWLGCEV